VILGSVALLGAAITAFYMSRVMILTFTSKARWDDDAHPHESPALMWVPIAILSIGSVTTGFLFTRGHALVNWLEPVVGAHHGEHTELLKPIVVSGLALAAVAIGVAIALKMYQFSEVAGVAPEDVSPLTRLVRKDLGQDALNEALFMRPGIALTELAEQVDIKVVDGAVRGVGRLAVGSGSALRRTQSGFARSYAAFILIGAIALIAGIWVVTQ
jgi:NADH-quinone oxidoreductase subunit L